MIIHEVISGGQTGADSGGLRAAKSAGTATGGYAPAGWMTEDGPAPRLADYGLVQHAGGYRERTITNVEYASNKKGYFGACLWFGRRDTTGAKLTYGQCKKNLVPIFSDDDTSVELLAEELFHIVSIGGMVPIVLMIAGNRESKRPGIGKITETYCGKLFAILKEMK